MRTLTSLTAMFTLALGLAACGDDKEMTSGSPTSDTPGTVTEPATDPSASSTVDPATGTDPTTTPGPTEPGTSTDDPPATSTEPATESATTVTTTVDPTATSTTEPGTSTETTAGGEPDANWPPPDPMNPMMPCPDGFAAASFSMGGIVCSPKCTGPGKLCPEAATGNAAGQCVFNPDSSGADCMMAGEMCEAEGEVCEMTGGGGLACLGPSSNCVLLCNGGEACPDGMECFDMLVCQYPV
jgi:hypothetical protein